MTSRDPQAILLSHPIPDSSDDMDYNMKPDDKQTAKNPSSHTKKSGLKSSPPYPTELDPNILGGTRFGQTKKVVLQGKLVVLKKLHLPPINNQDLQKQFLSEMERVSKYQHPRLVHMIGAIPESCSIIMEFMTLGNLQQFIMSHQDLKWKDRYTIASDIAQGMLYLHGEGSQVKNTQPTFHQNLKSTNVLLFYEKQKIRAKLSDYGFGELRKSIVTGDMSMDASRAYLAPELVSLQSTRASFSKKCDVYAYGVVLLELATLFGRNAGVMNFQAHLKSKKIPTAVKPLITMCLELSPKKRPSFEFIGDFLARNKKLIKNFIDQDDKSLFAFVNILFTKPADEERALESYHIKKLRKRRLIFILLAVALGLIAAICILIVKFIAASPASSLDIKPNLTWGGVNSPYLFALPEAHQDNLIQSMSRASIKVVRVFVSKVQANTDETASLALDDLQTFTNDQYGTNNAILMKLDALLAKTSKAGLKVVLVLHDRTQVTCDGDVYGSMLLGNNCTVNSNPDITTLRTFYTDAQYVKLFDERIDTILNFKMPSFNNRSLGHLSEAILSVDIQNRPLQGTTDWLCKRAEHAKKSLSGIAISTGGSQDSSSSFDQQYLLCPSIDILSIQTSNNENRNTFKSTLELAKSFADVKSRRKFLHVNYFGSSQSKDVDYVQHITSMCNDLKIPWIGPPLLWNGTRSQLQSNLFFASTDTDYTTLLEAKASEAWKNNS